MYSTRQAGGLIGYCGVLDRDGILGGAFEEYAPVLSPATTKWPLRLD